VIWRRPPVLPSALTRGYASVGKLLGEGSVELPICVLASTPTDVAGLISLVKVRPALLIEGSAMTRKDFAEGEVLFKEGDPPNHVFRLVSGAVEIFRELDGERILLGTVGADQYIGEMGVVENRPRSASARAASEVEVEIFTPPEFFDQIAGSPQTARELIHRLSQRLREADDRIVKDERRRGRARGNHTDSQTALVSVDNAYLAAKNTWLQRQFHGKLQLSNLPFIIGRGPVAREGLPPLQPDLKLDDTVPFRLSRNHFMIEKRDGSYYVRDLSSTLGTIVNGEPVGEHFRSDEALLRRGENEVIAGGVDSQFVFSVLIA
jgi:CRP/FNR family transcriptional regulator, cyclic AMP receptor protein